MRFLSRCLMVCVAAVFLVVWCAEGSAQPLDEFSQTAGTFYQTADDPPPLPEGMRKKAKKKAKKKTKKKRKKAAKKKATKKAQPKAGKYGLGLKAGIIPINDMDVTFKGTAAGDSRLVDYDFGPFWGWGAGGQYRLKKNFYIVGEVVYWFPQVDRTDKHPDQTGNNLEFKEKDGLLNIGAGLRFNLMGGEHTSDRVYLKGHFGFSDYIADDKNHDTENREGVYFNLLAGIEHMFARSFTVYADTGYYHNIFMSPGDQEEEATLNGWLVTAGFLLHWN